MIQRLEDASAEIIRLRAAGDELARIIDLPAHSDPKTWATDDEINAGLAAWRAAKET